MGELFTYASGQLVRAGLPVRKGSGALTPDSGRSWAPAAEPVDGYDFAVISGRGPVPASPFACVLTTSPASLTVHFGILGCFSPPMGLLSVRMSPDGAEFSGTLPSRRPGVPETLKFGPRVYSPEEGERLVRALWEAATRQKTQIDCGSTSAHTVIIEWSCPSGPIQEGKMSLRSSVCSPFGHEGYARARGVHDTALEALKATASPW
ncbi:hypothetical protein [Stigmatella hybrida]|uniref:hypothetical protein n=1 Tax=Stigmatella hybrida TaxID=394097 RepID=UPI001CDB4106|nr:hypothetical protein [Stigmatella hybrida]